MIFFERLNELIKQKGVTRTTLTKELHIGANQIKYWENNGNVPDGLTLIKLADYFNVSVDYLLGKTDKKTKLPPEEQPLTDAQEALLNYCSDLSNDDLEKVIDYIELLKLKNNATQKENIKLVARSGEQTQVKTDAVTLKELKEDTSSDY